MRLLLCILSSLWVVQGWTTLNSLTSTTRRSYKLLKAATTSSTLEETSPRLKKAKLLLEQYSDQDGLAADAITSEEETDVLPDNTWYNGNLMSKGNNYVTRWARGKNVAEPLVKYDPVAAEKLLFRQPGKWLRRNFQIATPIGWWAVCVVTDYVSGKSKMNRKTRAVQLTTAISDLGPAIIKGGQALSSRPDLLPSEYLESLQTLQDDVPRFSNFLAFKTVEEELGMKFGDVFELIEDEPIGEC
jgi:hypothetical protein